MRKWRYYTIQRTVHVISHGPGQRSGYTDSLCARRSGDRIPHRDVCLRYRVSIWTLWQLSAVTACKWTVQPVPAIQPSDVDRRQFAILLTASSSSPIRSNRVYHLKMLCFALQLYALSSGRNPVLKCIVWTACNVLRVWQNVIINWQSVKCYRKEMYCNK